MRERVVASGAPPLYTLRIDEARAATTEPLPAVVRFFGGGRPLGSIDTSMRDNDDNAFCPHLGDHFGLSGGGGGA